MTARDMVEGKWYRAVSEVGSVNVGSRGISNFKYPLDSSESFKLADKSDCNAFGFIPVISDAGIVVKVRGAEWQLITDLDAEIELVARD